MVCKTFSAIQIYSKKSLLAKIWKLIFKILQIPSDSEFIQLKFA